MSYENSTTNVPRLKKGRGRPSSVHHSKSRIRCFKLISYLSKEQLEICLLRHSHQIRACAYACHDKDTYDEDDAKLNPDHIVGALKEPHFHLVIVTYNGSTLSAVRRWFYGFTDSKDLPINTLCKESFDPFYDFDYLTHDTKDCIAMGKFVYSSSIINYWGEKDYFQCSEKSSYDNITLACEMLLSGKSIHDCGKIFGRDFILHYGAIKTYLTDVYMTEQGTLHEDINDVLKAEYFRKYIN